MKKLLKQSALFRVPMLGYRLTRATPLLAENARSLLKWLVASREHTNFTYDLTPLNTTHLAHFVATIVGEPVEMVEGYMGELSADVALREHVVDRVRHSRFRNVADEEPKYGRRLGWYAFVRALKPKVVIETGVDKGLGACVIAAALRRNSQEGYPGRYYGTDINPDAGYLLGPPYSEVATVLYGDSIDSLRAFSEPIDVFINDSDHSADYEAREYEVIAPKLGPRALVIGDNAHVTDRLSRFARSHGLQMLFFREQPLDHWYPGAGIGAAFRGIQR